MNKIFQIGDNDKVYDLILEPLKYCDLLKFRIIDT